MRLVLVVALLTSLMACGRKPAPAPTAPPDASGLPMAVTPVAADMAAPASPTANARPTDGPALWTKYCALCHGPEAKGYAADNAPSQIGRAHV